MKQSLQLRIPTPCGEDWARMQPAEKGRHCQSCCKTVVDFTDMSDAEIIRHLSQAGPHVCGRLMPDQLNRTLVPAPVQKNGRSGWAWVLASLLMLAKGSDDDRRPVRVTTQKVRAPQAVTDSTFVTTGMIMPILADTVKQIVADTLAALGWRPSPELNIYPNPVSRGGAMQLAWKTQPGQYQLTLMNTRGQLIAERMLDVGGAGLAGTAGVAGTAGAVAVCTREVMVR